MAATHIALLRGINVGKAKRISMAELRALVELLGCRDVRTLLNSGNVVFRTSPSAAHDVGNRLEKAIEKRCGFTSRVTILSTAELTDAIDGNPLRKIAHDHSRFLVAVPNESSDRAKLAALMKENWKPGALAMNDRVGYLWCPEGIRASRLAAAVNRALGDAVTQRNWATMLKLHALAQA